MLHLDDLINALTHVCHSAPDHTHHLVDQLSNTATNAHANNWGDVFYTVANHAAPGVGDGIGNTASTAFPILGAQVAKEIAPRIAKDLGQYYDDRKPNQYQQNYQLASSRVPVPQKSWWQIW